MRAGNSMIGAGIALALLAVALAPSAVVAQQARAINDGTAVRLDPDPASPVVATLQAGAVLELISESEPYYAVSIPGEPGEAALVGWVLSSELEVLPDAPADTAGVVIPGGAAPPGGGGIPALREQYERAVERSASGRTKAIQGIALAIAAAMLTSLLLDDVEVGEPGDYRSVAVFDAARRYADDRNSAAGNIRDWAIAGGAAITAYGVAQYFLGRRTMSQLELELPLAVEPTMQEQYDRANARRQLGRRKVVWGGALVLASNLTVAVLGNPVPDNYASQADYEIAVDHRNTVRTGRNWMTAAGVALGAWGAVDWLFGARDMSRIEETARTSALSVPFGSDDGTVAPRLFVGLSDYGPAIGLNWVW